ncbi:DUF6046 domain-containing protein [Gaoshiqia sp. Z1-71]|uniref:DUF6046 domain-containing protein n=1 Tax=Gaoshiqia hydrogeniformans TaxID=3290090 RepID=UPI003BF82C41
MTQKFTYDFASRFKTAFGFIAANAVSRLVSNGFGKVEKQGGTYGLSAFDMTDGTFDNVVLYRNGGAEKYMFSYSSIDENNKEIFATPPMLNFKRAKKLVVTNIDNTDVHIVERYATEPWEITWRGLLIDMENHNFPLDKLNALNQIFEVNNVWSIASDITDAIGVQAVYIADIEVSFIEGYQDTIAYTMTMRSIHSIEVQINKKYVTV